MYSSCGRNAAAAPHRRLQHLLRCKVMTFPKEDRHNYAGGPLIMISCGLLQLSLTLMLFLFFFFCCIIIIVAAADGARQQGRLDGRPGGWWGSGGFALWRAAAKELLKRALCEETHISKPTPAPITGDNRGNTRS